MRTRVKAWDHYGKLAVDKVVDPISYSEQRRLFRNYQRVNLAVLDIIILEDILKDLAKKDKS